MRSSSRQTTAPIWTRRRVLVTTASTYLRTCRCRIGTASTAPAVIRSAPSDIRLVAMPSSIRCLSCGATFVDPIGPCVHCGGTVEVSTALTGVESKGLVGQVGTVADSPTPAGGQQISYTAPSGARSNATSDHSRIAVRIERPVDVGTRGESRVLACVVAHLATGGDVPISLPASDEDGEDRILRILGERVTLQIVTATPDLHFWRRVAGGASEVDVPISEAAGWVNDAIREKACLYTNTFRASMLLAVDVGHMGVLAAPSLHEQYLHSFGDPSALFGFGGVWLVGPTENHCLRLGRSRW